MKKVLAMFLAMLLTFSIVSIVAVAEEQPTYVIDGVKDDSYSNKKMLTSDFWLFFENNGQNNFEPVDPQRVINTLWFDWDDTSVYLYFQCESQDDLYKPEPGVTEIPNFDFGDFYEMAQIYLDTAPSMDWYAPCNWAGQDGNGDFCNHMACNCREGATGSAYRLMARANPAFNQWNDYYATASGMFMSYETFCESYAGREGYEDLAAKYAEAHGNGEGQAVSFIDYDTNTYGFEMKFPRKAGEDHFQINIRTRVNETEWPDEGPELAYSLSFCNAWWMNSEGLWEIYFDDYKKGVDPAVAAIQRKIAQMPAVEELTREHKDQVNEILAEVEALDDSLEDEFTAEEAEWLMGAAATMGLYDLIDSFGDVNGDTYKNAADALVVLRAAVNKTQLDENQVIRADVTGDNEVNAKDALEILQYAVDKRQHFTVESMLGM